MNGYSLNGIGLYLGTAIKEDEGLSAMKSMALKTASGELKPIVGGFIVYDAEDMAPFIYRIFTDMTIGESYSIAGRTIPVSSNVYLLPASADSSSKNSIINNAVLSTVSNDDGEFTSSEFTATESSYYVYMMLPSMIAAIAQSSLSVDLYKDGQVVASSGSTGDPIPIRTPVVQNNGDILLYNEYSINKGDIEASTYDVTVTASGTCPQDVTAINFSKIDNYIDTASWHYDEDTDSPTYGQYIDESGTAHSGLPYYSEDDFSLCFSANASEGLFSFENYQFYTGSPDGVYALWCKTNDRIQKLVVSSFTYQVVEYSTVCLSGDTLITMSDGSRKRLDTILPGDAVLSQDNVITEVQAVGLAGKNSYHTVYNFEGIEIDETHEHRFYNVEQGFYQKLKNFKVGEHTLDESGKAVALVSKTRIDECADMYGLFTVSGSYYANGLLSGSALCNLPILEDASVKKCVDMALSLDEISIEKLLLRSGGNS